MGSKMVTVRLAILTDHNKSASPHGKRRVSESFQFLEKTAGDYIARLFKNYNRFTGFDTPAGLDQFRDTSPRSLVARYHRHFCLHRLEHDQYRFDILYHISECAAHPVDCSRGRCMHCDLSGAHEKTGCRCAL